MSMYALHMHTYMPYMKDTHVYVCLTYAYIYALYEGYPLDMYTLPVRYAYIYAYKYHSQQ